MALLKNSHSDSPDDVNQAASFDFPVVKKGWEPKTVSQYVHALIDKHDEELEVLANRVKELQAEESKTAEGYRQQMLELQQAKQNLELQLASNTGDSNEKTEGLIGRIAQLEAENNKLKERDIEDPELQKQLALLQEKEAKIQGDLGDISTSLNNAVESNSFLEEQNATLQDENQKLKEELEEIKNAHVVEQRESQKMGAIAARLTEALEAEKLRNEQEMAEALSEAKKEADNLLVQAQAEADNITQSAVKELRQQIDEVQARASEISQQREKDSLKIEQLFQKSNDEAEGAVEEIRAIFEKTLFSAVEQHRDNINQLRKEKETVEAELQDLEAQRQDILIRLHNGLDTPEEFKLEDSRAQDTIAVEETTDNSSVDEELFAPLEPLVEEEIISSNTGDEFTEEFQVEEPAITESVKEDPIDADDLFNMQEEEISQETTLSVEEEIPEEVELSTEVSEDNSEEKADDEDDDFELNFFTE